MPSGFDKGSKNQCQGSEIGVEGSATLRAGLLRTNFGGCPSSYPSWARYLPSRMELLSGPYAAASVDHEAKAVQRLKHRAGNSCNLIIVLPLISYPLQSRDWKAAYAGTVRCRGHLWRPVRCGRSHSEVESATPFQEGWILIDG